MTLNGLNGNFTLNRVLGLVRLEFLCEFLKTIALKNKKIDPYCRRQRCSADSSFWRCKVYSRGCQFFVQIFVRPAYACVDIHAVLMIL